MNSFKNMVEIQNPEKEYPINMGEKWSDDEEILLLEELSKNIDIQTISHTHNRTVGGINARRKVIAYKMYLKNLSIEEIIKQTKLDNDCIRQIIEKKQNNNQKKITEVQSQFLIESEIAEMKNEIKDLKNIIKELVGMIKAVYEFEDT